MLVLDATPIQMGILAAVGSLPALIFGLGAGVWMDRRKKRSTMIAADYGRAVLLLAVPVAAAFNALRIEYLYAIALALGMLTLLFGVASRSMLPSLVARDELVEANGKLAIGRSASEVTGPGVGGVAGPAVHGARRPSRRRRDLCGIRPGYSVDSSAGT